MSATSPSPTFTSSSTEVHSLVADPRFVDAKHDNYALHPESPAFKLRFEAIDTSKIGLLRDRCRCQIQSAGT